MGMLKHTKENRTYSNNIFTKENEDMFRKIGKEFGCKFLIATGSRRSGNEIPTSDYDFVIIDDPKFNLEYRSKTKDIENKLGIKIDYIVNNKYYPSHWIMLEIKN